jgi:hypothetical protein
VQGELLVHSDRDREIGMTLDLRRGGIAVRIGVRVGIGIGIWDCYGHRYTQSHRERISGLILWR